jgi:AcrR family transcriptional regulator
MIDKALRRSKILDVAQNLFAKFGLSKTTIEDIAKMAHIGKASIYYYFTSKEAIFKEVVEKEGKILKEKLIEAINSKNTPQEKIRSYIITRMTAIKELANYYSALREEYLKHYSFIEKARQSYDAFEITMISTILHEGQKNGIFDIENITLTAETIVAAMKGLEYQWSMEGTKEEIIEKVDALLRILFKGIEKRR